MNNSPVMHIILAAVADACSAILECYDSSSSLLQVAYKDDKTPVTQADMEAHQILEKCLLNVADIPVLSEEAVAEDFAQRSQWPAYWLVDPLDGTKEFIAGTDEFTVNVALVVGGRAVLGIIAAPVIGSLYVGLSIESTIEQAIIARLIPGVALDTYTVKAQLGEWTGQALMQGVEWIPVHTSLPAQPITVLASRSYHSLAANQYFKGLSGIDVKAVGSSLKMCLIAEGMADIYVRLGPTSEWDTAAAQAILEGAGGHLLDLAGVPLRYNQKASLLNPAFWASSEHFFVDTEKCQIVLKECEFNPNND